MSENLTFMVPGVAVPKGSRSTYRGRSVESSKRWPQWHHAVAEHAVAARLQQSVSRFVDEPVSLTVTFYLPKPKRRPKSERHITRPDLDKLVRGVCDALTGIVWEDDSQVNTIMAVKRYVDEESPDPFVLIRVAPS